jgi:hypothetical protein
VSFFRPSTKQSRKNAMRMVMLAAVIAGLNFAMKDDEAPAAPVQPDSFATAVAPEGPRVVLGPVAAGSGDVDAAWAAVQPAVRDCMHAWWMREPNRDDVGATLVVGPTQVVRLELSEPAPGVVGACLGDALDHADWPGESARMPVRLPVQG